MGATQDPLVRIPYNEFDRWSYSTTFDQLPQLGTALDITSTAPTDAEFAAAMRAHKVLEIQGDNAANANCTFSTGGGIKMQTASASADQMILAAHSDTNQGPLSVVDFNTTDRPALKWKMVTGSSIASVVIWGGLKLTNTSVLTTDDDQVYVYFAPGTNSGKWVCYCSVGGTDKTMNTDVTVAASTVYEWTVWLDESQYAHYMVNDVEVAQSPNEFVGDEVDLLPFIGVQTATSAQKDITLRGFAISKDQND